MEQVKSWIRISAATGVLAVLLKALWVHQDAPQMLQRVLAKLDSVERQQTARWNLVQEQLLHVLQTLRYSTTNIPAYAPLHTDATEIAARREQEQHILETMWQEALATGQTEVGAWNAVTTPVTFPGSTGRPPSLNPMDTSTPLPQAHIHALEAGHHVDTVPQVGHTATDLARDVQAERGVSKAQASGRAAEGVGKRSSPQVVPEAKLRNKAVRQENESGAEAEGSRMQQAGGTRKLKVRVGDPGGAVAGEDVDGGGERSARRSPRGGTRGTAKRVGEHSDDDEEGTRREKKLKAAQ